MRRTIRVRAIALCAVVCLSLLTWFGASLASPSEALAQDARALFLHGQEAYAAGNYETAIEAWEAAYALDPRPALQYNLAQAYGRLARVEEESAALRLYVSGAVAAGADPEDSQMVSARARLTAIADRIRRTGIQLSGVPDGARVTVDGEPSDAVDGSAIPLAPGPHHVTVAAEGRQDFNASIVVRAGETLFVPVMLQEQAPASTGISGGRLAAILCWSVGGASLAAGSVLGGLALSKSDGVLEGSAEADSALRMARASDVTLGLGAALGVAGIVAFVVASPDEEDDEPRARAVIAAPIATRGGAGLQVFGRF